MSPPAPPALTLGERGRLGLRLGVAVVLLAVFLAAFLLVRGVERLLEALLLRPVGGMAGRVVQGWAATALPVLGLAYVRHGAPMRGRGAFVANHSSWSDIVALQRAAAPFLVSKAEVRDWPGIGLIGRAIGTMFVDRRPAAAKRQEAELLARLGRGDRMAMFPEGTSTAGGRVLPFKSSLFGVFFAPALGGAVEVQPVTIRYHPREGLAADFYAWWGEMDFVPHLVEVLARSTGGRVELTFHAPLSVAHVEGRKALAAAAEQAVRAAFIDPETAARGDDASRG